MPTAQDVLNVARAEIGSPGSVESPLGSNSGTKYHAWYGNVQGYQWCAIFQSWLFFPTLGYKSYYTGDWINYGTRNGWMILGPVPGAICVMDRYPYLEQGGISDHVGVIESVNGSARTMTLVEGNYSDRVARVTRPIDGSTKYYFILPRYGSTPAPKPKPQEDDDMILAELGKAALVPSWADGANQKCYLDFSNQSNAVSKIRLSARRDTGDRTDPGFSNIWTKDILEEGSLRIEVGKDLKLIGGVTVKVEVLAGGPVLVTRKQTLG